MCESVYLMLWKYNFIYDEPPRHFDVLLISAASFSMGCYEICVHNIVWRWVKIAVPLVTYIYVHMFVFTCLCMCVYCVLILRQRKYTYNSMEPWNSYPYMIRIHKTHTKRSTTLDYVDCIVKDSIYKRIGRFCFIQNSEQVLMERCEQGVSSNCQCDYAKNKMHENCWWWNLKLIINKWINKYFQCYVLTNGTGPVTPDKSSYGGIMLCFHNRKGSK